MITHSYQVSKTFEILDVIREEDKETYFFRKTKLIPNSERQRKKLFNLSEENICHFGSTLSETEIAMYQTPSSKDKVKFKSFEIIRLVGLGSFGKIFLVKKKMMENCTP